MLFFGTISVSPNEVVTKTFFCKCGECQLSLSLTIVLAPAMPLDKHCKPPFKPIKIQGLLWSAQKIKNLTVTFIYLFFFCLFFLFFGGGVFRFRFYVPDYTGLWPSWRPWWHWVGAPIWSRAPNQPSLWPWLTRGCHLEPSCFSSLSCSGPPQKRPSQHPRWSVAEWGQALQQQKA